MAEKSIIISAEEEAILLKPIDEYVGKIQEQIDALRVEGSDKVNSLKNQIAIAKENKNLTKEEQNKIIGECKKNLEKAKATEDANKQQIAKLIADYKEMDVQMLKVFFPNITTVSIITLLQRAAKQRKKRKTVILKN